MYEPNSYIPLARVDTVNNQQELYYYHTDQIVTPLELTNEQGTIVWQANYKAWGEVESLFINEIEQNFTIIPLDIMIRRKGDLRPKIQ